MPNRKPDPCQQDLFAPDLPFAPCPVCGLAVGLCHCEKKPTTADDTWIKAAEAWAKAEATKDSEPEQK